MIKRCFSVENAANAHRSRRQRQPRRRLVMSILRAQSADIASDTAKQEIQKHMERLAFEMRDELQRGNILAFGQILAESWSLKSALPSGISNEQIDAWYRAGRSAGAIGGKILGASSGGFLMFSAPPERHAAIEFALSGLRRVRFKFDPLGTRIIFYNPVVDDISRALIRRENHGPWRLFRVAQARPAARVIQQLYCRLIDDVTGR